MRRLPFRFRLLLPLLALAGTVMFLPRCGNPGVSGPAPAEAAEAKPQPEPPPDVDAWAASFARQLPPPAALRQDGTVLADTLANGLRCLILEQPAGEGVSLRLLVLAGSVHETEEERGFAHFVEHMAFRGTTHHAGGDALAMFERLGLKAGSHTNAFTAPDCTIWKLDVPLPDETALTTSLQFLRDVTDGILFREADVAAEREVVLRELEERYGKNDIQRQRSAAILPDVRAAHRPPGGTPETVARATAAGLRAFWARHYVPSRMVLVAAGDLQTREMAARLHRHFDSLPAREAPPEPPAGDPLAAKGTADVACLTDPSASQVRLTLAAPQPVQRVTDDPARRRSDLVRRVMLQMMSDRLDRLSAKSSTKAVWREAGYVNWTPQHGWLEISGRTAAADLKPALTFLAAEWLRARDRGFNEVEFDAARQGVRRELLKEFATRIADGPADAADTLVQSVRMGTVFESPEDEMNRDRTNLDTLTKNECEARCREDWGRGALTLIIEGKNVKHLADEAQRIVNEVWSAKPAPPKHYPGPRTLEITAPGPPGKVVRRTLDAARGLLEAELSNGVRIWLKPMPGLGGVVSVRVHGGHGVLSVPPDQPALHAAARLLMHWHPLPGWRDTEFEAALAREDASVFFETMEGTFSWHGETSRRQLARQLEVLCACVHSPGLESLPEVWTPSGRDIAFNDMLTEALAPYRAPRQAMGGNDPRMDPAPPGFEQTDSTRTAAWLMPLLKKCRLCVMIAGDFAPDTALDILRRTFGALPRREPWDQPCPFPPLPAHEPGLIRSSSKYNTATVMLMLPFPWCRTPEESINLELLGEVVSLRLRSVFRDKLFTSYSPGTDTGSAPDKSHDWLVCQVHCDTARLDETAAQLRSVLAEIRTGGWTEDEFQRAARPYGPWVQRRLRQPGTWNWTPTQPLVIPAPAALKPEVLLLRQAAVKKLADEGLDVSAASEVHLVPNEDTAETE